MDPVFYLFYSGSTEVSSNRWEYEKVLVSSKKEALLFHKFIIFLLVRIKKKTPR